MATYTIIPFNWDYYYSPQSIPAGQVMEGTTIYAQEGDVFVVGDLAYGYSVTTFLPAEGETAPVSFEVVIDQDISDPSYTDVFQFVYAAGTKPSITVAEGVDASALTHNGSLSDGIHVTTGIGAETGGLLGGTSEGGSANTYDIGDSSSVSYIDGRSSGEDLINLGTNVTTGFIWTSGPGEATLTAGPGLSVTGAYDIGGTYRDGNVYLGNEGSSDITIGDGAKITGFISGGFGENNIVVGAGSNVQDGVYAYDYSTTTAPSGDSPGQPGSPTYTETPGGSITIGDNSTIGIGVSVYNANPNSFTLIDIGSGTQVYGYVQGSYGSDSITTGDNVSILNGIVSYGYTGDNVITLGHDSSVGWVWTGGDTATFLAGDNLSTPGYGYYGNIYLQTATASTITIGDGADIDGYISGGFGENNIQIGNSADVLYGIYAYDYDSVTVPSNPDPESGDAVEPVSPTTTPGGSVTVGNDATIGYGISTYNANFNSTTQITIGENGQINGYIQGSMGDDTVVLGNGTSVTGWIGTYDGADTTITDGSTPYTFDYYYGDDTNKVNTLTLLAETDTNTYALHYGDYDGTLDGDTIRINLVDTQVEGFKTALLANDWTETDGGSFTGGNPFWYNST